MDVGGLGIDHRHENGVCLLKVSGELDLAHSREMREAIVRCEETDRVVVDTTELTFIDSTGFAALVVGRNRVGPDRFQLVPGRVTERLVDLSGARRFFGL